MRSLKLHYLARAQGHLESIFTYIEHDDRAAAERVIARIRLSAEHLLTFPYMGRAGSVSGTFEHIVPGLPYIIVYRVDLSDTDEIVILGVFHGAREREVSQEFLCPVTAFNRASCLPAGMGR